MTGLSGQRTFRVTRKAKNQIGEKIWKNVQELMAEINVPSLGPHQYDVLDALCKKNNCQAIVYSGLDSAPTWTYPKDLKEIRPDLPSIFLEEKVCLDPNSKDLAHLDVIIRPEQIGKKFMCTVCHRLIYSGKHRTTCLRPSCFYCRRKRLQKDDWYDSNMVRDFCPSAQLHDHPAVTFLNGGAGEQCPKCHHRIWTASCMERHRKNCNGRQKCLKCGLNIIAYRGEVLEEKWPSMSVTKENVTIVKKC